MSIRPSTAAPVQDMPPVGGYRKLDLSRYLPDRGPKGWQLWAGTAAIISYGYYQIGQGNISKREQKTLERRARYAIAPVLQAEADREFLLREKAIVAREAEIMKGVPNWTAGKSPYFNGAFMPRKISQLDRNIK